MEGFKLLPWKIKRHKIACEKFIIIIITTTICTHETGIYSKELTCKTSRNFLGSSFRISGIPCKNMKSYVT